MRTDKSMLDSDRRAELEKQEQIRAHRTFPMRSIQDETISNFMRKNTSFRKADFEAYQRLLQENEVVCHKYNYSLEPKYQNKDSNTCTLNLS